MKKNIFLLVSTVILFYSCETIPNGGIPSYVKLNQPIIITEGNQGATVHGITDLWLESEGVDFGAYEYPNIIPLFLEGSKTILTNPGIPYNGEFQDRQILTFFEPYDTTLSFKVRDTVEITPRFKYKSSVNFNYIENFETGNNFLETSRTEINDTNNVDGKAALITLNAGDDLITARTSSPISIIEGQRVMLQFSMKTEGYGGFGIENSLGNEEKVRFATFAPFSKWATIYFEITHTINTIKSGEYHFFFDVSRDVDGAVEKTYIDNFNIIQF